MKYENKKTCGECKHMSVDCLYCKNHLSTLASRDQVSPFCGEWEPKSLTVFDRITVSPEMLAPNFVFLKAFIVTNLNPKQQWISTLTGEVYPTRAEAIAATVEKLKEVCYE